MINGIISCARYAFAPNFYKYCGPDENKELREILKQETLSLRALDTMAKQSRLNEIAASFRQYVGTPRNDNQLGMEKKSNSYSNHDKLARLLLQFQTLYPYLKTIAEANNIENPFDPRVTEAYWTGNNLLKNVRPDAFYKHLKNRLNLSKKLPKKTTKWLYPKIDEGALPDHSFHVFNIFVRTGHTMIAHTVETMDNCRISWGKVLQINENRLTINSQQLTLKNNRLTLKKNIIKTIQMPTVETINIGDYVSGHWGWFCDQLTPTQVQNLEKLTLWNLELANKTI